MRAHYRTPSGEQRNKTFDARPTLSDSLRTSNRLRTPGPSSTQCSLRITVGAGHALLDNQTHLKPSTHERDAGIIRSTSDQVGQGEARQRLPCRRAEWVTVLSKTRSPATVRKVHRVLSLILNMAVKDGRLARNVAIGVISHARPRRSSDS